MARGPIKLKTPNRAVVRGGDFVIPAESKAHWFERFEETGAARFLTLIAHGFLPAEIAYHNDLPMLFLQEWVETTIPKKDMALAMRAHAQMLMSRSMEVLEGTETSVAAVAQHKAASEGYRWAAERVDSEVWGNRRDKGPPQVPVTINLNLGSRRESITIQPAEELEALPAPEDAE